MPYLIDASNLGGVLGGRRGARDPGAVVRFLLPWARGRGRVVAIFDGPARPEIAERYGALEVRWSAPRAADERLVALVEEGAESWTVITGDRTLARRCREAGARVEPPAALVGRVSRPHPGDRRRAREGDKPEPGREEIERWRRLFEGGPGSGPGRPEGEGEPG